MKKFKLLAISALLVTLITGCKMKAEYSITISKGSDVKIDVISAMDDEMIDAMMNMGNSSESNNDDSKTHTDKERWEYVEKNSQADESYQDYKKEKYDKDGYKGYTYSLNLGKIDKLVTKDTELVDFEKIGKEAKIFTKKGNVYSLNVKSSDEDNQQVEQYSSSVGFDLKLKVKLPSKAKSNNATEIDGTTYIWDLTKVKDINLSFTLDGKSSDNNVLIIGGICAGAAIVICGCVLVLSKKKNKKAEI